MRSQGLGMKNPNRDLSWGFLRQPGLGFPRLVLKIKGFSLGSGALPGSVGRGEV